MGLLLREAIGDRLRRARTGQHRTLRDVSKAARVSLGYLSEVERGRKEASSELLAAICGALELPLADLLKEVAFDLGDRVPGREFDRDLERDLSRDLDRELDRELDRVIERGVIEGGRLAGAGAGGAGAVGNAKSELRIAPRLTHRLTEPISSSPADSLSSPKLAAVAGSAVYAA